MLFPFLFIYFFGRSVFPQEMPVPAADQGVLIPKILLMNKNFADKKEITIGIIYSKYSRSSVGAMEEISEKIRTTDFGVVIRTIQIEMSELEDLREVLGKRKYDALYIAPLRGFNLASVKLFCRENKIVTLCCTPDLVQDLFSVSFGLIDSKIKILINLKSALEEGADFSSRLLKIAQVYNK